MTVTNNKSVDDYYAEYIEKSDAELELRALERECLTGQGLRQQAAARAVLKKRAMEEDTARLKAQLVISKNAVWATWAGAAMTAVAAIVSFFNR